MTGEAGIVSLHLLFLALGGGVTPRIFIAARLRGSFLQRLGALEGRILLHGSEKAEKRGTPLLALTFWSLILNSGKAGDCGPRQLQDVQF